jgi:hypothetical protein
LFYVLHHLTREAPSLQPGQQTDVSITFRTPSLPGEYAGSWQMSTHDGRMFLFIYDFNSC